MKNVLWPLICKKNLHVGYMPIIRYTRTVFMAPVWVFCYLSFYLLGTRDGNHNIAKSSSPKTPMLIHGNLAMSSRPTAGSRVWVSTTGKFGISEVLGFSPKRWVLEGCQLYCSMNPSQMGWSPCLNDWLRFRWEKCSSLFNAQTSIGSWKGCREKQAWSCWWPLMTFKIHPLG